MEITEATFKKSTGRKPEDDDLERANCDRAGQTGHSGCGWCAWRDAPAYEGCDLKQIVWFWRIKHT